MIASLGSRNSESIFHEGLRYGLERSLLSCWRRANVQCAMRRQRLLRTAVQMATASTPDASAESSYNSDTLSLVYDVCACVLALLFGAALMKLLRDYTRRKGYIEIQQDDRNMYSNVLTGTSDSWENVRVANPKQADDAAI